jgi:hypothetical protein
MRGESKGGIRDRFLVCLVEIILRPTNSEFVPL